MLNEDSLLSSVDTAIKAANKDKVVVAVNGTPLAQLVSITTQCIATGTYARAVNESTEVTAENLDGSYIGYATNGNNKGPLTAHDTMMDTLVAQIAPKVVNHISFAKNVVSPLVVSYINSVTQAMAYDPKSAALKFNIEVNDLPEPLTNGAFESSLSKFKEKKFFEPEKRLKLGTRTAEELFALLQTGSKEFDGKLAVWYATLSPEFIGSVWANYFGSTDLPVTNVPTPYLVTNATGNKDNDNTAILVYLLAQKLQGDIPKDANVSLAYYNDATYELMEAAAVIVLGIYDRYTLSINTNTLVEFISYDRKTARVNGTVYREWLKTGGSAEVILGMLTTNKNARVVPDFAENSEAFRAAWYQYEEVSATVARNNSYNRFVAALRNSYGLLALADASEQEKELLAEKPEVAGQMQQYLEEELNNIKNVDLENVNDTCLRVMCRSRFFYTDAEKFLTSINNATKANPLIDVRTAALIATIEYVTDYVADQMQVV